MKYIQFAENLVTYILYHAASLRLGYATMVKFGVCILQDRVTYPRAKQTALKSEELGFDSVWLFDHLHSFPSPDKSFIECWTTLSALAEATKRIRLGPLALDTQYRNPALVAKMTATFDQISNGRLEFGIGAGGAMRSTIMEKLGYTAEHRAYGMDFPEKPAVRISRLREAVQIIKKLWTEDDVTFDGKHYKIKNAFCYPKPIQKPYPPVSIGGMGEQLSLKVIARFGDGCSFNWNISPEEYARKLEILSSYCRIYNRSVNSIRKSLVGACVIEATSDQVRETFRAMQKNYEDLEGYVIHPLRKSGIAGTPEECIRKINEFVSFGVEHFILLFPELNTDVSLERFARTVMSSF